MLPRVPVDYLFNRTCPSHEEGRRLLGEAAVAADVAIDVRPHEVRTDAEAERLGFFGSPAFIVAGADIAAPPEGVPARAEACRAYRRPDGQFGPLPALDDLAAALRRAVPRPKETIR